MNRFWTQRQRSGSAKKHHGQDDSSKALNDSFSYQSPSLWLAIWDGGLSLQDSLAYGYTRLQLIDALATSSINLALNYREEPEKTSAYDYALTTMSTIPQTKMTCDTSSDENYGPCHATIILQYPTFQRDIITIEARMQWQVSRYRLFLFQDDFKISS